MSKFARLLKEVKAALLGVPVYRVPDPRARLAWGDYAQVGKELLKEVAG